MQLKPGDVIRVPELNRGNGAKVAPIVQSVQKYGSAGGAKIQGRITERETGRPVSHIRVNAVHKSFTRDGVPETSVSTSTETDDSGAYTIVTAPGRYYVATDTQAANGAVFAPQYFPAANDVSSAMLLNVSLGAELRDIDIAVPLGNKVRVSGRFLDGLGRNLPHMDWVGLIPRSPMRGAESPQDWRDWRSGYRNAARYEIAGVAPGSYYLMSWRFDDISDRADTVIPIDVAASDLEVDVTSYKGYSTSGRFRFPPGKTFSVLQSDALATRVRITARSLDGTPVKEPGAILDRSGQFRFLPLPAGAYRLSILGIRAPFYVKAVKIGSGPDALDVGFTVPTAESMEVVIGDDGAEVRGFVREGGGSTVVLVPDGRPMLRTDLYKIVRADNKGFFVIGGIAPGAYRLFASSRDMSGNPFFDPDYLSPIMSLAPRCTLQRGRARWLILPS